VANLETRFQAVPLIAHSSTYFIIFSIAHQIVKKKNTFDVNAINNKNMLQNSCHNGNGMLAYPDIVYSPFIYPCILNFVELIFLNDFVASFF